MLPWEHPPRKPIGRPEEVAAGEGVHVRGWGADLQREGGGWDTKVTSTTTEGQ